MEDLCTIQKIGQFIKDFDILFVVLFTIIGWYFTYRYNVKVQRKNTYLHAKNEARLEITKSLREYQDWLFEFKDLIYWVMSLEHKENKKNELRKIINKTENLFNIQMKISRWLVLVEEYEGLFPYKKGNRGYLCETFDKNILNLSDINNHIKSIYSGDHEINDDFLTKRLIIIQHQINLMNDLTKGYQNLYFIDFKEYTLIKESSNLLHQNRVHITNKKLEISRE